MNIQLPPGEVIIFNTTSLFQPCNQRKFRDENCSDLKNIHLNRQANEKNKKFFIH